MKINKQELKQIVEHYNNVDLPITTRFLNSRLDNCLLSPNQNQLDKRDIDRIIRGVTVNNLSVNDSITRYGATLTLRILKIVELNFMIL